MTIMVETQKCTIGVSEGDAIRGNPAGNRPGGPKTSQFKSEKVFVSTANFNIIGLG